MKNARGNPLRVVFLSPGASESFYFLMSFLPTPLPGWRRRLPEQRRRVAPCSIGRKRTKVVERENVSRYCPPRFTSAPSIRNRENARCRTLQTAARHARDRQSTTSEKLGCATERGERERTGASVIAFDASNKVKLCASRRSAASPFLQLRVWISSSPPAGGRGGRNSELVV